MTDRVSERRHAAHLARHYRDQEGLTIAGIARRLGHAESTVKAYLYDPIGEKAREVKARYRASAEAAARRPARARARVTRMPIASDAVRGRSRGNGPASGFVRRGAPGGRARALRRPPMTGRAPTHAGGEALKRLQTGAWPAPSTVIELYGSWAAAVADTFGGA
jgi:hypothetical protein